MIYKARKIRANLSVENNADHHHKPSKFPCEIPLLFQVKQQKAESFAAYDASELKCSMNSAREHSWHRLANHVLTTIGLPHRSQYAIFAGTVFSSIILSLTPVHMKYTRFKVCVIDFFFTTFVSS